MNSLDKTGKNFESDQDKATSSLSLSGLNHQQQSLRNCVEAVINNYFHYLDGQEVSNMYDMVLTEVEAPLLKAVMKYSQQNQTKASSILGINRGTLRKKLEKYGL